jgi:hypothetical protein
MLTAARTEAETRHLAGLPVNASIEEVEKDKPAKLADALQVTSIPGIDLSKLTKEQRIAAITKLNDEPCTCGCNQTLARCRVDDPTCPVSLPRAKELITAAIGLRVPRVPQVPRFRGRWGARGSARNARPTKNRSSAWPFHPRFKHAARNRLNIRGPRRAPTARAHGRTVDP